MHGSALRICVVCGIGLAWGGDAPGETLTHADLLISQDDASAVLNEDAGDDGLWRPRPWRVSIEPMLWYAGMQGEVRAPGSSGEPQIEDINLDDSRGQFGFETMFRDEEDWGTIRVSAFSFSQDANGRADEAFTLGTVSVASGEQFSSEVALASLQASYSWAWLRHRSAGSATRGFDVRVDPYVGLRAYDVRFELRAAAGEVDERETWADVIAGLRMEMEFSDEFSLDLLVDAGGMFLGDTSSSSANVQAGFQWRPTQRFGAQIGYRFLFTSVTDDDGTDETRFSGSLAGLYGALVWRF